MGTRKGFPGWVPFLGFGTPCFRGPLSDWATPPAKQGARTQEPQRRLRVEEAVRQDGTRFPKGTVVLSGSVAFDMHEPKSGIVGG
jgi:hypothetical protein